MIAKFSHISTTWLFLFNINSNTAGTQIRERIKPQKNDYTQDEEEEEEVKKFNEKFQFNSIINHPFVMW